MCKTVLRRLGNWPQKKREKYRVSEWERERVDDHHLMTKNNNIPVNFFSSYRCIWICTCRFGFCVSLFTIFTPLENWIPHYTTIILWRAFYVVIWAQKRLILSVNNFVKLVIKRCVSSFLIAIILFDIAWKITLENGYSRCFIWIKFNYANYFISTIFNLPQ